MREERFARRTMLRTTEEVREFRRVVGSFRYFVAHYVHLADGGGMKFCPWPWQLRLAQVWRERRQVIILKGAAARGLVAGGGIRPLDR